MEGVNNVNLCWRGRTVKINFYVKYFDISAVWREESVTRVTFYLLSSHQSLTACGRTEF